MQLGHTTVPDPSIERDAALEQLLLGDLLDLLNDPGDPSQQHWLVSVIDALLQIFSRDSAEDGTEEYLGEVLDAYPSWERQVQALHLEHKMLEAQLRELRDEVFHSGLTARHLQDLNDWIAERNEHRSREIAILQTAINLEVGVGD